MKKRLLSTLLALCVVLTLLPGTAWAGEPTSGTCGENLTWSLAGDTLTINGTGVMDSYNCDNTPWRNSRDEIKYIIVSNGPICIGAYAFSGFNNLSSISIPNSVTSIGPYAFYGCNSLTSISIPDDVTFIGEGAFFECNSLTNVAIPNNVTIISDRMFWGCSELTSISIPNSVTSIGQAAFYSCSNLNNVSISNSAMSIGASAFYACHGLTSISIPNGVTSIGGSAFYGCDNLTSISIPNSVTSIGYTAFNECSSLRDVYYRGSENDWTNIYVHMGNQALLNATIHYNSNSTGSDDVNKKTISGILRSGESWNIRWNCDYQIGDSDEPKNGSVEITVNSTNTNEELYLYNEASNQGFPWELPPYNIPKSAIRKLIIRGQPDKRLRITTNSFKGYSNLETIVFDYVSGVDSYAFDGCASLQFVGFLSNGAAFTSIGEGAFRNCSNLTDIEFPASLTRIGAEAFQNTKLGTITLGSNVTEIGRDAFTGCNNLKIRCYEDSAAHQYAVENNIPFQLITQIDTNIKNIPVKFYTWYDDISSRTLAWGLDLFKFSSTEYIQNFAELGLTLSAATENSSGAAENLLHDLDFNTTNSENYGERWQDIYKPGVTFGYQAVGGKHYFAIAIRGTTDPEDYISDLYGFTSSASNLYLSLRTFISERCGLDFNEIKGSSKFFVTGHSLGGATANVLAKKLSDEYGRQNIYCYAFAPPKPIDWATGLANAGQYNNIFNIVNFEDPVTYLPNLWARYGKDIAFHRWSTPGFDSNFQELTGSSYATNHLLSAHDVAAYMAFIMTEQIGGTVRIVRCACPVDVAVYDSDGILVGRVIDNVVSDTEAEKVFIRVEGDEKYLYLLVEDDYTVKLTSTDEGAMTYSVQEVDMSSGEIKGEIVFENVALARDKQMSSAASTADISKVPLYVLNESGDPEKEVLPDGEGTEIPITTPGSIYTITLDPHGGTVTPTSSTTNVDGKLASLPTPTRSGYTFNGWFTAPSGGARVTTDTVFSSNTTIYAQWTYVNTSGGNTTPSGSLSSNSSSDTTYNITIPSVAGGAISVSPKSASKGSSVTITATPDVGYELVSVTATDSNGKTITLTDKGNGKYTFTMSGGKVSVSAVFQLIQSNEPEVPWDNPFSDISEGEWYYEAVRFVQENGLMNGYSDNTFAPNANLSRAMLAQILYNKEGRPTVTGSNAFADVVEGAWYTDAVTWAAANGIVGGYGNGRFGPGDNITREQLAVMLWRYAGEPTATSKELHFNDANEVSGYALDALRWAVENSIINGYGDGRLNPGGQATRAQVAQILMNFLRK